MPALTSPRSCACMPGTCELWGSQSRLMEPINVTQGTLQCQAKGRFSYGNRTPPERHLPGRDLRRLTAKRVQGQAVRVAEGPRGTVPGPCGKGVQPLAAVFRSTWQAHAPPRL